MSQREKRIHVSKRLIILQAIFLLLLLASVYWKFTKLSVKHCLLENPISYLKSNFRTPAITCGEPCNTHSHKFQALSEILESYQQYHKTLRMQMAEGAPIKTLTWYCLSGCNGIGDRMKGMYAAFLLAVVMNRTFFIYQSDLIQRQMLLEQNSINWRPVNKCLSLNPEETLETFGHSSNYMLLGDTTNFSLEINRLNSKQNVYISGFRLMAPLIDSIHHSSLKNPQFTRALSSYDPSEYHCLQSVLHQFLFKVSRNVVKATSTALENLNLHPQRFVSVHIRTGFMSTFLGDWTFKSSRFARTKTSWRRMLEFALETADKSLGNGSLVLVSSDDQEPKNWATRTYGSRIRTLNIHPVHVSKTSRATDNEYLQNWVELSILAQSYAIVRTRGGFSDVASHMCSINPHVYYTYSTEYGHFV